MHEMRGVGNSRSTTGSEGWSFPKVRSCCSVRNPVLGSPATVARPLDFRTIDLRLASGAYGGSREAFLEDVRELWNNVRVAFGDQPDLVELAEKLSQNFESLYTEEVVAHVQKFTEYAKAGGLSAEMRKEVDDFIASTSEIPKAPWDEGLCKVCGIDRDDDSVLLCDTCDAEYHTYCLNPPLARIPEGNWYCPSCVDGKHATQDVTEPRQITHSTQDVTAPTQITSKRRSKKFQGELNYLYLEALTHLSAVIEEKEYWENSVGERTFLLKFLCDELLNSSLIRQHLEQCAELSVELHQKLRARSRSLRSSSSPSPFPPLTVALSSPHRRRFFSPFPLRYRRRSLPPFPLRHRRPLFE